jgi:hypothetical protein
LLRAYRAETAEHVRATKRTGMRSVRGPA